MIRVTELDKALRSTQDVLAKVEPGHLDAATPCASWNVGELINHFIGTTRWWAAMVTEAGSAAEADYAAGDYVAAYEDAIGVVVAAFDADGALSRSVRLPFGEFPATVVLGMAATEGFTHGWDLARAIGYPADLDPGLATELLSHARLATTDAYRGPDGQAPFGPAVRAPAGAGPADQLAAFLGRTV